MPQYPRASSTTETLSAASIDHTLVRRFRLTVVSGRGEGSVYESDSARTVVGSHPSCALRLGDPAISRYHFEIRMDGGVARLEDLQSRNGTVVNGVRVLACFLGMNAMIEVGGTRLRFELRTDSIEIPLATGETFGFLVGRSAGMRAVFAVLEQAAPSDVPLLIRGEAGTGKDLAAASVHFAGVRRERPFVVVDCAAGPDATIERQLFGAPVGERGAVAEDAGALERARGGTVYLDEVAGLSYALQVQLLRALESREVQRPGARKSVPIDVRVIALTRRNLQAEVNARRFRSSLLRHLSVLDVTLPPLRERAGDITVLIASLLETMGAAEHPAGRELLRQSVIDELSRHAWPGNVRELRVHLERCIALAQAVPLVRGAQRGDSDGPPPIDTQVPLRVGREAWVRYFERAYITRLLAECDGNVSAAARAAGVDRVHLYRLMARAGMR